MDPPCESCASARALGIDATKPFGQRFPEIVKVPGADKVFSLDDLKMTRKLRSYWVESVPHEARPARGLDEISGQLVDRAAGGKSLGVSLGRRETVPLHPGVPECQDHQGAGKYELKVKDNVGPITVQFDMLADVKKLEPLKRIEIAMEGKDFKAGGVRQTMALGAHAQGQ